MKIQPLEETLLGPSGTLLLVLLEHPFLVPVGPGLCPLLLLVIVTLSSQCHFSVILLLLHPPPPICICSLLLAAPWQPATRDIICSLMQRITVL